MGKLILLTGGARSGKSYTAQQMAEKSGGKVVYLATAQALDEEMQARIAQHRQERPDGWQTLEAPQRIAGAWLASGLQADVVILDCITMLATNVILSASPDADAPDEDAAFTALRTEIESLQSVIQNDATYWLVVTNEVGMGLVPPYPLGRIYRDLLGWANRQLAAQADEVYLLVAGIPVPVHSFRQSNINSG